MIADLKPYPEYRETGSHWLGKVPTNWAVCRIKTILRELDCRAKDGSGVLLSLTRKRGLIPHKEMTDKMHSAKTLVGYKRYSTGQIVMNRMQAWSGMFGTGPIEGLVSPDYAVFEVLEGHNTSLVLERLKSPDLVGQFALESKGIGSGFNRLYTDRFGQIPITLPPYDEQAAIVRFLNHTNQRIERTIRAKQKVIALLNEQKQVIIHRAVTRGLDPNVRLKPSGIPWLGEIPVHWEVRRNGYIFKERNERGQIGLPVLIVSLKTGVTVGSEKNEAGRERRLIADHTAYKLACQGDIAYNMMRMWQGAVGVVPALGLVSPAYVVAQPLEGVRSSYYELLFRTDACKGEINRNSRGIVSDRNRLYWDDFKRLFLPVPPLAEQICIVENLSNQFAEVDLAISRTEHEIDLLREYRTRLIADVVTGKLDVREAAAQLPDEVEEVEVLEDDAGTEELGDIIDES